MLGPVMVYFGKAALTCNNRFAVFPGFGVGT